MKELLSNPAFRFYVLCAVPLAFNPLILAGMTGGARGKYKSPAASEDAKLTGNPYQEQVAPEVDRLLRAHRNALENVPIGLIAGLIYVLAGAPATMVLALMGAVVAFRWLHSVCYLKSLQPWRSVSFGLAALATAIMLIHAAVLAVQAG
jgi:prostaglandin-E synthase 1